MGAQNQINKSQSLKPSSPSSQQTITATTTTTTTTNNDNNRTLIFTYGTLKRGFPNHNLMEQLITQGEAEFLGTHSTAQSYPLVCGPYRIPFLLNLPGRGRRVIGELYAVSGAALDRIDELEGTTAGHYERLPIAVAAVAGEEAVAAEAYYGHRSYGEAMWRRCGERGHGEYTAEVADGYVWRKDRPVGVSFLQRISLFVSSSDYD